MVSFVKVWTSLYSSNLECFFFRCFVSTLGCHLHVGGHGSGTRIGPEKRFGVGWTRCHLFVKCLLVKMLILDAWTRKVVCEPTLDAQGKLLKKWFVFSCFDRLNDQLIFSFRTTNSREETLRSANTYQGTHVQSRFLRNPFLCFFFGWRLSPWIDLCGGWTSIWFDFTNSECAKVSKFAWPKMLKTLSSFLSYLQLGFFIFHGQKGGSKIHPDFL